MGLTGIVTYDVWWVVRILAEPAVDWWDLLGPCLGEPGSRSWRLKLLAERSPSTKWHAP
ncbi:hypothetical protein WJ438_23385 [Streptomyces sp. GD-15H]|uniref:hypothetical protein n=1 Tax=Streptomyces sp. GD-15H TaxID=3129112 RepID=UPI00324F2760